MYFLVSSCSVLTIPSSTIPEVWQRPSNGYCAFTQQLHFFWHVSSFSNYRKIPTQRPPPSKRPPPFSAPKVLQRGHISSCNRPERLFLGTCRLTLYEKCSVMVTFLFHQLSCQMSSRAISHPLVSGALNAKRPWAIGRDFTVLFVVPADSGSNIGHTSIAHFHIISVEYFCSSLFS